MSTHGVTLADVELMVIMMGGKVSQATIRQWLSRGKIHRSRDGLIDAQSVINWWDAQRNHAQADRRRSRIVA